MNNVMNQETFVRIIQAILDQRTRQDKFAEAIQNAFTGAGELPEFHTADSFIPPTGLFVDQILEALSYAFVGPNQTQEEALDHINYFIYELDLIGYTFMEPISPENEFEVHGVPAHYTSKDGTEHNISTPEELYKSLLYEMTAKPKRGPLPENNSKMEYKEPTGLDLCNSVMHELMQTGEYKETFDEVLSAVRNQLGDDNISEDTNIYEDIVKSADSIDSVEIFMDIERRLGITLSDEELERGYQCKTPKEITLFLLNRIK